MNLKKVLFLIVLLSQIGLLAENNVSKQFEDINASLNEVNTTIKNFGVSMEQQFKIINNRIDKITYKHQNRFVPYKDIETVYDFVIGKDYQFKTPLSFPNPGNSENLENKKVTGLIVYYARSWIYKDEIVLNTNESIQGGRVDDYKLLAVEERLGINRDRNETNLEKRLDTIYNAIHYDDWNGDRIKFNILTDYLYKKSAIVTSVGVMVFPGYKKYIPGNFNILRRTAIYLGVGQATSLNENESFNDNVYSAGFNVELQHGFGLHAGWAIYSMKVDEEKYKKGNNFIFGVTLSSDLWKSLFNFNR